MTLTDTPKSSARRIVILALPGVQLLDVAGPLDVFAEANAQTGQVIYELKVCGVTKGPVKSSSGISLVSDLCITDSIHPSPDTFLIAGCPDLSIRLNRGNYPYQGEMLAFIKTVARKAKRFGSVCSGALLLAEAGLLKGKRVTTHWSDAPWLAEHFPSVIVEPDAFIIRDGKLRTCAGVTAGLDLALSLIEEDFGREVAKSVAAKLVMYFKRVGGQLQFSRQGSADFEGRAILQDVQRFIAANPKEDLSNTRLAERVELSPRHFARLFKTEVGETPARYVEQARIAFAKTQLENNATTKSTCKESGFNDMDTFRRVFIRLVGVSPSAYRKTYASNDISSQLGLQEFHKR